MPHPSGSSEPGASPRFPDLQDLEEFEQLLQRLRELHACALGIPKLKDKLDMQEVSLKQDGTHVVQPVQMHMGPKVTPVEITMCQSPPDSGHEPTIDSLSKASPRLEQVDLPETTCIQDAKPPKVSPRKTHPRTGFKQSASEENGVLPPCISRQAFLNDFKAVKKCIQPVTNKDHEKHTSEAPGPLSKRLMPIVKSNNFEIFSSSVILVNCFVLGLVVERNSRSAASADVVHDLPTGVLIVEYLMTAWFVAEVAMRMIAAGKGFFFQGQYCWNIFDFIVVSLDILEVVVRILDSEGVWLPDFTALRIMRVLRIVRALKMLKIMGGFRDFRMMVQSILHSGSALFWTTVLFSFIIYVFSIYFMQQVAFFLRNTQPDPLLHDKLVENWGTVPKSYYTLFLCMSGGISWVEISTPLKKIHWVNTVMLSFYMFFMTFVVTNIVMGIFVDSVMQSAQGDREEVVEAHMNEKKSAISQLREIFLEADEDGNKMISLQEFHDQSKDPRVWAYLSSLGLDVSEADGLFKLLDMDGSGTIGIEEFLMGCMRLKGYAKTIDLATLMYENRRLTDHATHFYSFAKVKLETLVERIGKIENSCAQISWLSSSQCLQQGFVQRT